MGYAPPVIYEAGWRPAADHLASGRAGVARSGHGRRLLGTALGGWLWGNRSHTGHTRKLSAGEPVHLRVDDDAARQRPPRRDDAVAGAESERATGQDRRPACDDHDTRDHRRLHLRRRQLRRAPRPRCADWGTPMDEPGDDPPGALEHGVHGATRRSILRQQRSGVSHRRAVYTYRLRRAWSHQAHRGHRAERPDGRVRSCPATNRAPTAAGDKLQTDLSTGRIPRTPTATSCTATTGKSSARLWQPQTTSSRGVVGGWRVFAIDAVLEERHISSEIRHLVKRILVCPRNIFFHPFANANGPI